mmetsp:Transcript_10429/g.18772  ORF Transcript_10429/g.18772 Transcript_10429/m.18772 type:complete len:213 (-) Transcript_10429:107-745(-)
MVADSTNQARAGRRVKTFAKRRYNRCPFSLKRAKTDSGTGGSSRAPAAAGTGEDDLLSFDAEGRTRALTELIQKGVPDFPKEDEDYIVCRKNDGPGFVFDDVYGGPDGVRMRTYAYGESGVRQMVFLPKGHVEAPHFHSGQYEWLVLSGVFKVRNPCTGREHILREGDYYCNPGGVPHTEEVLEAGYVFWIYHQVPDCHCLTGAMRAQLKQA